MLFKFVNVAAAPVTLPVAVTSVNVAAWPTKFPLAFIVVKLAALATVLPIWVLFKFVKVPALAVIFPPIATLPSAVNVVLFVVPSITKLWVLLDNVVFLVKFPPNWNVFELNSIPLFAKAFPVVKNVPELFGINNSLSWVGSITDSVVSKLFSVAPSKIIGLAPAKEPVIVIISSILSPIVTLPFKLAFPVNVEAPATVKLFPNVVKPVAFNVVKVAAPAVVFPIVVLLIFPPFTCAVVNVAALEVILPKVAAPVNVEAPPTVTSPLEANVVVAEPPPIDNELPLLVIVVLEPKFPPKLNVLDVNVIPLFALYNAASHTAFAVGSWSSVEVEETAVTISFTVVPVANLKVPPVTANPFVNVPAFAVKPFWTVAPLLAVKAPVEVITSPAASPKVTLPLNVAFWVIVTLPPVKVIPSASLNVNWEPEPLVIFPLTSKPSVSLINTGCVPLEFWIPPVPVIFKLPVPPIETAILSNNALVLVIFTWLPAVLKPFCDSTNPVVE